MVEPVDRAIHAQSACRAAATLWEAASTAAWDAGRALPLERVMEEALLSGGTASAAGEPPVRPTHVSVLTVQEHQVAALVARGLTNPQIAEHLVISRRTADRHVSNILDKLGLATRAAVAAWAVERRERQPETDLRVGIPMRASVPRWVLRMGVFADAASEPTPQIGAISCLGQAQNESARDNRAG